MAYAALLGVDICTTEVFLGNIFAGNGLYNLRTGEEHVRDTLGHDCEVGEGGGVYGTAGAGTENCGDLGNNAGSHDVALENFGISCKCVDAFLNAGAAGVVKTDNGRTHLHGHIHDFADLLSHCFGEGTAEYGEVLCENINKTAVNGTVTGNDAVA